MPTPPNRQGPIDPHLLYNRLKMVKLDDALTRGYKMDVDDFEYFSMIGQGSCSPSLLASPAASPMVKPRRRATSVKQRRERGGIQTDNSDEEIRPRTNSMPSKDATLTYQRVRNFSTIGNSLKNQGDTYRSSHGSGSHSSIASSQGSDNQHRSLSAKLSTGADSSSSEGCAICGCAYKILVMGAEGVGKTAITRQFLQSDDVGYDDEQLNDEDTIIEPGVSVSLNGVESNITFMDYDYDKNSYDPSSADAYIVVYSITDRQTFDEARGILKNLRHFEKTKAIFLCGNKSDLARRRVISDEEGKRLAVELDAKFIETSTMLNHKVDQLLVGMLSQMKLESSGVHKRMTSSTLRKSIKGLVTKIIRSGSAPSKKRLTRRQNTS